MMLVYTVIFGTIVLLGITVVVAFVWAIGNGQLRDFQRGATSIFDPDEPVGMWTDGFPGSAVPGVPSEHDAKDRGDIA